MKVTTKTQGPHGTETTMAWANHADEIGAMLAVAQLLQHAKDDAPFAPRIVSITIEL